MMTENIKENSRLFAFLATVVFFAGSLITAVLFLWRNNWFGTGDFQAFVFWSIPLLVGIYVAARQLDIRLSDRASLIRYIVAALSGLTLSSVWTAAVAVLLGGWFGAFSFNVFYCWLAGSTCALFFSVLLRHPSSWPLAFGILLVIWGGAWGALALTASQPPDMLVTLKGDTKEQDIQIIYEQVLGHPSPTGVGYKLIASLSGVGRFDSEKNPRILVSFWPGTSDRERERVRSLVLKSPMVIDVVDVPSTGSEKFQSRIRKGN